MAACTKTVQRRSACQGWVKAEEIYQHRDAQRLEASTSGGTDALESRRVSTAVVGERPREWGERGLSGQVIALQRKTVLRKCQRRLTLTVRLAAVVKASPGPAPAVAYNACIARSCMQGIDRGRFLPFFFGI